MLGLTFRETRGGSLLKGMQNLIGAETIPINPEFYGGLRQ
jgi:hypothetical protein